MIDTGKKTVVRIDCSVPASDSLFDPAELEQFFHDKIKVDGKTGNFEKKDANGRVRKAVVITRDNSTIIVESSAPMRKRYVKYLAKMYFSRLALRDFLRVLTDSKDGYKVRYFKRHTEE